MDYTSTAWNHIAFAFKPGALSVYINAKLAGEQTVNWEYTHSAKYPIGIGSKGREWTNFPGGVDSYDPANFFVGYIDDVAIYDQPLTAQDISGFVDLSVAREPEPLHEATDLPLEVVLNEDGEMLSHDLVVNKPW